MKKTLLNCVLGAAIMGLSMGAQAQAENYPNKAVRIVIPFASGGGTDIVGRPLADKLREKFGQSFVIDNRPGAGGNIGAELVYRAPGDGYTLLFVTPGQLAINKFLYDKIAYEPDEFMPISVLTTSPNVLAVTPRLPVNNVRELIAYAKANPTKINFASAGAGTTTHLSGELLNSLAGIKMVHVPYNGAGPYLAALVGGQVETAFFLLGTALPQIQAGRIRAIAVGSEKPSASLPGVPPVLNDLPGFVSTTWYGIVAAPKTPTAITNKLSAAMAEIVRDPEFTALMAKRALETVGSTPQEMAKLVKEESDRWSKVIRATGAKVQ